LQVDRDFHDRARDQPGEQRSANLDLDHDSLPPSADSKRLSPEAIDDKRCAGPRRWASRHREIAMIP
jgi:hypothetical protein